MVGNCQMKAMSTIGRACISSCQRRVSTLAGRVSIPDPVSAPVAESSDASIVRRVTSILREILKRNRLRRAVVATVVLVVEGH